MQCILLATDGSKSAERAADFAAQLAKAAEAPLWIATVTDDLGLSSAQLRAFSQAEHASRGEIIESIATQLLAKARDRAEALGVHSVHVESRRGDIAQTILEIADAIHADTIVVGKRGLGTLTGLLVGSVTQKLVSLAPCTVIVVP